MATLLRRYYGHRYFLFSKRYCSNDNNKQIDKLQGILKKLKAVSTDSKDSTRQQPKYQTPVFDAQKITQQRKQRDLERKQLEERRPNIQNPLPIPDRLDITGQHTFAMQKEMDKVIQTETKKDRKHYDQELKLESEIESKIEKELEPTLELELESEIERKIMQSQTESYEIPGKKEAMKFGRYDQYQSERFKQKNENKIKYEQIANDIKNNMKQEDTFDINFNIDSECQVSKWIYEQILECNGTVLPTPNDIIIQFPFISVGNAKQIRDDLVDKLINCCGGGGGGG
eukprot:169571_1